MWEYILNIFRRKKIEVDPMKYLICGLGNPGGEYEHTRHNVGFRVVEMIAEDKSAVFKEERHGLVATIKHRGRTVHLLKPMTYMNLSGKAVRYWVQKLNLKPENLLVCIDDLNLHFGTIRMRKKGKDGGHNGLKDINQHLGTENYNRLRVGIGNNFHTGGQVDYVLGKWSPEERAKLPDVIDLSMKAVYTYVGIGMDRAQNQIKTKI
jgi:PTH1 family peptidyl-tRNA hydrolase